MYHALFLMLLSALPNVATTVKTTVFYLVVFGLIFFSGSIYLLATNVLTSFDFKKIGFITPIGGTLLIAAWGVLLYNVLSRK
ncbi:Membrane protein YwdK [Croceitalea dokdonensis DOKDO 023]|uniref:Membrane protein YwdK n=2 Tax=Croceitalea TaxID=574891 RepID=A0A0P7AH16_9FLAO|nr:Membrane protein YwdK [Croceitalea dokdonensis DOKDO 023]